MTTHSITRDVTFLEMLQLFFKNIFRLLFFGGEWKFWEKLKHVIFIVSLTYFTALAT